MSRIFGIVLSALAIPVTAYFGYALFDSITGDYVGGEVLTVWILTAVAAVIAVFLWLGSWSLLRPTPSAQEEAPRERERAGV